MLQNVFVNVNIKHLFFFLFVFALASVILSHYNLLL